MLKIQSSEPISFSSKNKKESLIEKKYRSFAAIKANSLGGIVTTGGTVFGSMIFKNVLNYIEKNASMLMRVNPKGVIPKILDYLSRNSASLKKGASQVIYLAPVFYALNIFKGAVIDAVRTKKLSDFNDAKKVMSEDELKKNFKNTKYTPKHGSIYLKTNDGKKLGTLFGALTSMSFVAFLSSKKPGNLIKNLSSAGVLGSLGGLLSGTLIDIWANHGVKKHADMLKINNPSVKKNAV